MIHDHDMGAPGCVAYFVHKALIAVAAAGTETRYRLGVDAFEQPRLCEHGEQTGFRQVAGRRGVKPSGDREDKRAFLTGQKLVGGLYQPLPPGEADIIPASLEYHRPEPEIEHPRKKRDVLEKKLFLQILGVRRDDHPLVGRLGEENRRCQISDGFARARTRLGEEIFSDR